MDTNNTVIIALRLSRRVARNVAVIGVASCVAVTGLAAAAHGASAASSPQSDIISADHTHKGDRLSVTPKHTPDPKAYASCFVACCDNTLTATDRV
jgi:hypothetical protein